MGAPRRALKPLRKEVLDEEGWDDLGPGVTAKRCPGPKGEEPFVLCRSKDRQAKEAGIHERFSRRIEERLTKLEERLRKVHSAGTPALPFLSGEADPPPPPRPAADPLLAPPRRAPAPPALAQICERRGDSEAQ